MTFEQKMLLREAVDEAPEQLLDALGIDYEYRGGNLQFLCPFHDDNRIGNCGWVHHNGGYMHCFACQTNADCFALVQHVRGCSFGQAAFFISGVYGIRISSFKGSECVVDPYLKVKLTASEKEAVRIPNEIPLRALFNESPESYRKIITLNARKSIGCYKEVINKFGARDAEEAYKIYRLTDGAANAGTYEEIKQQMTQKINICESVILKMEDESI